MEFCRIDHCVVPAAALQAGGGEGGGRHTTCMIFGQGRVWLACFIIVLQQLNSVCVQKKRRESLKCFRKCGPNRLLQLRRLPLCPSLHRRILSRERQVGRGEGGLVEAGLSNQQFLLSPSLISARPHNTMALTYFKVIIEQKRIEFVKHVQVTM